LKLIDYSLIHLIVNDLNFDHQAIIGIFHIVQLALGRRQQVDDKYPIERQKRLAIFVMELKLQVHGFPHFMALSITAMLGQLLIGAGPPGNRNPTVKAIAAKTASLGWLSVAEPGDLSAL
jgi:hypothetical protein